ncbi:hypothetical protein GLYMA_01G130950v4 [Glycine max]|nr:hypothetical protein GLYMA_01G130950v4 [Glycine max]KAG5089009.1 hypothetical protein JHK86_001621 [Glycine max]
MGGLQAARDNAKTWITVQPVEGAFVVNLGDLCHKVGRSLFCLGLLICYGNQLLASSILIDVGRSVRLFMKYLFVEDFVVKVRSLQALGFVLIARPEYMLENDVGKILEETISSTSDTSIKIQGLQNMFEYLF